MLHLPSALLVAGLAGWSGLTYVPRLEGLADTCGELSLWVLVYVTEQTGDPKVAGALTFWALSMVLAMMAPGLHRPVDHIASQSMPRRTASLVLAFFVVYTVVWLPAVAVLMLVSGAFLFHWNVGAMGLLAGLVVWFGWACTPIHQKALNRGHVMRPLRSFREAIFDVCRLASQHAGWCIVSCWPMMLLPMLSGGFSEHVMFATSVGGALMRALPPRTVRWRVSGFLPMFYALQVTALWAVRHANRIGLAAKALSATKR